ncbi:MAG: flagellar protein FliT [Lachnospiraceae bacterium]|nr:flagellar protein FliT [Lachnospiraceae bacterium]
MLNNYLNILEDSLKKKIEILERIDEVNQVQSDFLKEEQPDLEAFDKCVDEKDVYIKELEKLDEGFDTLYEKIKQELLGDRDKYADQIKRLQKLITEITDKSVSIQAQERRNKALVEKYFTDQRKELGQVRKSSKAAYGYYQNMSKSNTAPPQFMDTKK